MKNLLVILFIGISIILDASPVRSSVGHRHISMSDGGGDEPYSAKDYVQDGLVAIWDGIENTDWDTHDTTTDVWIDLVSGISLKSSDSFLWNAKCLLVSEPWLTYDLADISLLQETVFDAPKTVGEGYTVEIVVRITTSGNKNLFGERFNAIGIFSNGGKICGWLGNGNNTVSSLSLGYIGSVSFITKNVDGKCGNYAYTNGRLANMYLNRSYSGRLSRGRFGIGEGEYPAWGVAEGEYYCIRMYNRVLTEEEINHNYEIDKARFDLP